VLQISACFAALFFGFLSFSFLFSYFALPRDNGKSTNNKRWQRQRQQQQQQ